MATSSIDPHEFSGKRILVTGGTNGRAKPLSVFRGAAQHRGSF